MTIGTRNAVAEMFAAAEIEPLFAAALRGFVALQAERRGFSRRHFLERTHLGGGGLGGVVHQRGRLVFFAGFVQLLDVQVKIDVPFRRAVAGFAASFINVGVPHVGFIVRRQRVMSRLGGMAFGAGFAAYVLGGVYRLTLLRLRGVFVLVGLLFGRLALDRRRGQRSDACRDLGCQRRQKEGYHQTYLQSSHKPLLVRLRSSIRFSAGSGSHRIDLKLIAENYAARGNFPLSAEIADCGRTSTAFLRHSAPLAGGRAIVVPRPPTDIYERPEWRWVYERGYA